MIATYNAERIGHYAALIRAKKARDLLDFVAATYIALPEYRLAAQNTCGRLTTAINAVPPDLDPKSHDACLSYTMLCHQIAICRNELTIIWQAMVVDKLYSYADDLRIVIDKLRNATALPAPSLNPADFPDISGEFQTEFCGGSGSMVFKKVAS